MLDGDQNASHEIWGVWLPRGKNGRLKWPEEPKVKIIERVGAGEMIASIARQMFDLEQNHMIPLRGRRCSYR